MPDNETIQLSERELELLKMVATGASNQQIAHKLVISVNTVKVHLRNIFEKLGVQSRTEATTYAIQKGWVTISDNGAEPVEAAPPSRKSFLLTDKPRPPLTRWQQLYLAGAMFLALTVLLIPLLPQQITTQKPILPVIYAQPATRPPPTPANPANRRWITQASMPTKRAGLGVVAIEGRIYAIGGIRENNQATRLVEIYDPIANTWSEGAAKPTAAANIAAVVSNGKIYIPGGCTSEGEAIKSLEIYNPKDDSWNKGKVLPEARCGYGLAALADKLYLFGGWDGQAFVDTVLVYAINQDQWEIAKSKLPRPMGYAAAVALNDKLYVAGGYDGEEEFDQLYVFDPATSQWQQKASMQAKRGGLGLVGAANSLYAIGGGWNQAPASSEKYDLTTDSWSNFDSPMTEQWRNMGLTVIDTKIYAVGGWNGKKQRFMDTLVSYQFLFQLFIPISNSRTN